MGLLPFTLPRGGEYGVSSFPAARRGFLLMKPCPRQAGRTFYRALFIREEPVDAMLGLGNGLSFFIRHGSESRLRQNGQVCTSRINASTPTRPLPYGNDFVPTILVGLCCGHKWASQIR